MTGSHLDTQPTGGKFDGVLGVLGALEAMRTLVDMGYDARSSAVEVRFDAIRVDSEGRAVTRRFEARETGVPAEGRAVGAALNRAANRVAAEVAELKTTTNKIGHRLVWC